MNVTNHLRYLYANKRDSILGWVMFVIPSILMLVAIVAIGYSISYERIGMIPAAVVSLIITLVTITAFSETFPAMPSQSLLWQRRFGTIAGWGYIGLSSGMGYVIWSQLRDFWETQPASAIPGMSSWLSFIGIAGCGVIALIISSHRLPIDVHKQLMEYDTVDEFQSEIDAIYDYYRGLMESISRRFSRTHQALSSGEREALIVFAERSRKELHTIEKQIIKDMPRRNNV